MFVCLFVCLLARWFVCLCVCLFSCLFVFMVVPVSFCFSVTLIQFEIMCPKCPLCNRNQKPGGAIAITQDLFSEARRGNRVRVTITLSEVLLGNRQRITSHLFFLYIFVVFLYMCVWSRVCLFVSTFVSVCESFVFASGVSCCIIASVCMFMRVSDLFISPTSWVTLSCLNVNHAFRCSNEDQTHLEDKLSFKSVVTRWPVSSRYRWSLICGRVPSVKFCAEPCCSELTCCFPHHIAPTTSPINVGWLEQTP